MTWLGLSDWLDRRFDPNGLGIDHDPSREAKAQAVLATGTIVVEDIFDADSHEPLFVAALAPLKARKALCFQVKRDNRLELLAIKGSSAQKLSLGLPYAPDPGETIRLSFSWDSLTNWARLAFEYPERNTFAVTSFVMRWTVALRELEYLFLNSPWGLSDNGFVAFSSRLEPLGPRPSLPIGSVLMSSQGPKPICDIKRGDVVRTADGEWVPVLQKIEQSLPAAGLAQPVVLRAPFFGLHSDQVVSADQILRLSGTDVEYIYGKENVRVPAGRLLNSASAVRALSGPVVRYAQILMPRHDLLSCAGATVESLFLGRMRRKPDLLAQTALNETPKAYLPEHVPPALPMLSTFEAHQLTDARVA